MQPSRSGINTHINTYLRFIVQLDGNNQLPALQVRVQIKPIITLSGHTSPMTKQSGILVAGQAQQAAFIILHAGHASRTAARWLPANASEC